MFIISIRPQKYTKISKYAKNTKENLHNLEKYCTFAPHLSDIHNKDLFRCVNI